MVLIAPVAIFMCSLISYYYYEIGMAPFPLVGVFLMITVVLSHKLTVKANTLIDNSLVFSLILYILSAGAITTVINGFPVLMSRFAILPIVPIVMIFSSILITNNSRELYRSIGFVLAIHLFFFYYQLILYVVTGNSVDFLEPVTGESQRVFTGSYSTPVFDGFIRSSGLFAEPGTYANVVFPLFLIYKSMGIRLLKVGLLPTGGAIVFDISVLISIILSFSFFGYIFLVLYLLFSLRGKKILYSLSVVSVTLSIVYLVAMEYLGDRLALGVAGGWDIRLAGIESYWDRINWRDVVFGWGFLADTSKQFPDIVYNDLGLSIYLLITTGIIGLIGFVIICVSKWRQMIWSEYCLFFVVMMSKLSLTHFILWIYVAYLLYFPLMGISEGEPKGVESRRGLIGANGSV